MEKIKQIVSSVVFLCVIGLCSCTNYNYIDGGLAKGDFDGTMWEYFHAQGYDWDSLMVMAERGGMKEWFDGSRNEKITFFGVTNLAVMRFIKDHDYDVEQDGKKTGATDEEIAAAKWYGVNGIPADSCRAILERLIIPGKELMMDDVPKGKLENKQDDQGHLYFQKVGGDEYPCLKGIVFCWTYNLNYGTPPIPQGGEKTLWRRRSDGVNAGDRIASCNIHTTTGIVHALGYDFVFKNL